MNIAAFRWGRYAAADPKAVEALRRAGARRGQRCAQAVADRSTRRSRAASHFSPTTRTPPMRRAIAIWVEKAKAAEAAKAPGKRGLAEAVARNLFKLMAYKDEYEVARLYTNGEFLRQVAEEFDGDKLRFEFHLAPPLLARRDPATGEPRKITFGPWMMPAFRLLARLKFLRGTAFDPFGYDSRAAHGAQADRGLRDDLGGTAVERSRPRTIISRSASRRSRKRSAASATSSCAI